MGISASVRIWELFSALETCVSLRRCSPPHRRDGTCFPLWAQCESLWMRPPFRSKDSRTTQSCIWKNLSRWQFKLAGTRAVVWRKKKKGKMLDINVFFFFFCGIFFSRAPFPSSQLNPEARFSGRQEHEVLETLEENKLEEWKTAHPKHSTNQPMEITWPERLLNGPWDEIGGCSRPLRGKQSWMVSLTVDELKAFLEYHPRFLLLC